jgi:predicted CopG family antitoxin
VSIVFEMYKRVNIGLRDDVYNKLKDKGRFGESFSELVSRLIDESNLDVLQNTVRRGSNE